MPEIVGGPELLIREEFPFPGCDVPPVVIGTGEFFVADSSGVEVQAGNFSIMVLSDESESVRYFDGTEEVQSSLAATSAYRFSLTGDSFAMANLERIVNQQRIAVVDGEVLPLQTVRDMPTQKVRMIKELKLDPCETPECGFLELVLWRVYFDVGFTYALTQAQITQHVLNAVAVPDITEHPSQPFGYLKLVCPQPELS